MTAGFLMMAVLAEHRYKTKNLQTPQTENEGIQRILPKTVRQAGLILLFAEKCSETPEPTSAIKPVS